MATKVTQAAKVGAFLLAMGAGSFLVYRTVAKTIGSGEGYTVHAFVGDASGIAPHSRVLMAGIPVGSIHAIKLDQGRARIEVRVKSDVHLMQSAKLAIRSASLLGENVVVLTPGLGDPEKKDGDEIETLADSRSMDSIKDQVGRISDLVEKVAASLAGSVGSDQGQQNMKDILQNVAQATEQINLMVKENRLAVRETITSVDRIATRGEPEVAKILENVRDITADLKTMMAQNSGKEGAPGELRSTIERVNRASKSLEETLDHANTISGRIDRGEGTLGRLSKDDALINEVQGVAEGIGDYVDRLTRLQTVVGLRSDYNFITNTIKSYVELRLQPREDKYYVIELINDPRGKTSFNQTDVDTTNPNEPSHYRTVTTTTTDAFRFTIQFARRMGPFTGRFGIKESTGGLGLDIHLLSNRFEIVNDFFGFGEEIKPRYRLFLAYEFVSKLWLLGGVDHVFVGNRRDYFLGMQLRFTDDDLKSILPFSGGVATGAH